MTCRKGLTARRCEGADLAPGHLLAPNARMHGKTIHLVAIRRSLPCPFCGFVVFFPSFPNTIPPLSTSTPSAVFPSAWRKRLQEATLPSTISITIMHISPVGAFRLSMRTSADPWIFAKHEQIPMSDEDLLLLKSTRPPSAGTMSAPSLSPVLGSSPMPMTSSLLVWSLPCWVSCTGKMPVASLA